jgi:quercetin dioxygenase-like cupin family protein
MMFVRRRFLTIAGAALVLPATERIADAQPSPGAPKLKQLLKADLTRQNQTVQETVVSLLEMAPGVSAPWHMHPGAQEIVFVLDGALIVEIDGEAPKQIDTGAVALIPAEIPHLVRNERAQTLARALVTHSRSDKEEPFVIALKREANPQVR